MQGAVPDANFEEVVAQTSAGDSVASSVQMQKATAGFLVQKCPCQTCCDGILFHKPIPG